MSLFQRLIFLLGKLVVRWLSKFRPLWYLLPALAPLIVFSIYPAFYSLVLSFFEVAPFSGEHFYVGVDHYRELASDSEYFQSLLATATFAMISVPMSVGASLVLALLLEQRPYAAGTLRTLFLLPLGVSPAMAAMLWIFLFNPTAGYLNYVLELLHIPGPNWLTEPRWAMLAVCITTVWKEIGFNLIFFLGGLAAISPSILEAARIDGAGYWRQLRSVQLPLLAPTLLFVCVISIIHACESFGQIHILTHGGPADATNVLVYKIYRDGFEYFRAGFASAQAVILLIIVLSLTALQFLFLSRKMHYGNS